MNLKLNDDQKMLLEMVKKFARNQILPRAKERDEKGEYPLGNHEATCKTWDFGVEGSYSIRRFWREFI